jgi:predicted O-methyltransferase YrrM
MDEWQIKELKELIKKKKAKSIMEIGTYAGQVTLMLAEVADTVKTIDYDQFHSPSVTDHLQMNTIRNVDFHGGDSLRTLFELHYNNTIDLIYIDRDMNPSDITPHIKKNQSGDVVIVKREQDKFAVDTVSLKAPARKKVKVDKVAEPQT